MAKKLENMDREEFDAALADLDDDALMEEWTALGTRVQEDRERLLAFSKEHQKRVRKEQMLRVLGGTSPEDAELLQEIIAAGIESEEAVMSGDEEESVNG